MKLGRGHIIGIASGLIIGLVLTAALYRSQTTAPGESLPRVSGSGPRDEAAYRQAQRAEKPANTFKPEQFQAKLQEVRRQVGEGFGITIVEPFVVASDQSAGDFQDVCSTVQWAVRILNQDFFSAKPGQMVTIYLFRDEESYRKHTWSMFGETPSTPYGYYSPQRQALIMNIATGTGTLVHEMVHPLLAADFPGVPSWFDEGLASLYEQCRQKDGHIVGLVNWRLPVLQARLNAGRLVPLEELLATTTEEFYDDSQGIHYAQARYLCYYLQERGLLRDFYRQFREHAAAGDPTGKATLLRITGKTSLTELQDDWLGFVGRLRLNGR